MIQMRGRPRSRSGHEPGVKVDARSERWREHRKKVRAEIVDAAFRAIDRLGPELSLREIAEEAGTAKPKIYRHFTDKSDLFQAIGQRMRDMLWSAIIPSINVEKDSAREIVGRGVEHYVELVEQHPNVVRFLLQGRFADQSAAAMATVNKGRDITLAIADMVSGELEEMASTRPHSNWPQSRSSAPQLRPPTGGWVPTTAHAGCLPTDSSLI